MLGPSVLSAFFSVVGVALSTGSGYDWDTDDDDSDSPFASEGDDASSPNKAPEEEASASDTDSLSTIEDAQTFCDTAMTLLHDGNPDRAFDHLRPHWAFSTEEMTQLQGEVERTRAVIADRYGDALDYRLLRTDTAGDVLARFVYLERFALHGLRWRFTFYEGAGGWSLNDVYFDDKIEALLD